MNDLTTVKNFYEQVERQAQFDYQALAQEFQGHDIFANPPQMHKIALPFFGNLELGLVAIRLPDTPSKWLGRGAAIAEEDGKYHYGSRVSFMAIINDTLNRHGYEALPSGPFAGMVELSCRHSTLFGHPARHFGGGSWPRRSVAEFVTKLLPRLVNNAVKRFYPHELHQFPFDDDQPVLVFAKDVDKIGGYKWRTTAGKAMEAFRKGAQFIRDRERGNALVSGHIQRGNVTWVIPAFGRNHVAFNSTD